MQSNHPVSLVGDFHRLLHFLGAHQIDPATLDEESGRIGSLAIVDCKVAAGATRVERYETQLQVYTAAGRGDGLTVEAACLHELRDGTRRAVNTATEAVSVAVLGIGDSVGRIRTAAFTLTTETARCRACDIHPVCRHSRSDD